jgi:RNA polymerase sigma-70 factor (ECF subfamily)
LQRAGAPLERRDPEAHARIVERLRAALETQDRKSLLNLFTDAPELVSDEPVRGPTNVLAHSPALAPAEVAANSVAKAPARAAVCAHESASVDWMERLTSLARQASHAELVSVDGAPSIALLVEGEVVALIDVSTAGSQNGLTSGEIRGEVSQEMQGPVCGPSNGSPKIVSLRAVTSASRLEAANRVLGRAAVAELLTRIRQRPLGSIAMGRDFPVDVYA